MRRLATTAAVAAVVAVGLAGTAAAQNPNLPPTYGSVSLTTGFVPDPNVTDIDAGGPNNARNLGNNCRGWVFDAPDVTLNYSAGNTWPLNIYVESDVDTTLVVMGPNGQWSCDDDGHTGLNPLVEYPNPLSGRYQIWVGTYSQRNDFPAARVYISELDPTGGSTATPPPPQASTPDWSLPPQFGSTSLNTGFLPDPFNVNVNAGGPVNGRNLGGNCRGYVDAAPDYRLQYQAGNQYPLNFYVDSQADTTLIVNAPNGQWFCNDDFNGLQPALEFTQPQSGQYDIWVGTYSSGAGTPPATLSISELYTGPGQSGGGGGGGGGGGQPSGGIDPFAPPVFGSASLNTGYPNDPYVVNVQAGGNVPAGNVDQTCRGYVDFAPTFVLNYQAGSTYPLNLYVDSQSDTTLMVMGPNGAITCNDDFNGLQPAIIYSRPQSGQYSIWVGTYSSSAGFPSAQLNISELFTGPGQSGGGGGGSMAIDPNQPAAFGRTSLNTGFVPDPYVVRVQAGGDVDAFNVNSDCRGFVDVAPTYSVQYQAGPNYPFNVFVNSQADTTLLVRDPNGRIFCNDDYNGLQSALSIANPVSGEYDIWVGTYNSTAGFPATTLYVSEIRMQP